MTQFCTYVSHSSHLAHCQNTGINEVILEHQGLSRMGGLDTVSLLKLLDKFVGAGLTASLQWDLLQTETHFRQSIQILQELPLERFQAIRVQDLGAAEWIRRDHPRLPFHWIVEGSSHNLEGLLRWTNHFGQQLQRLVLSSELPGRMLKKCFSTLPVGCEILGLGRLPLFYTPRMLISPLTGQENSETTAMTARVAVEDTPQRKFRTLENVHGTFLFYDRDLFLLDHLEELRSWGLEVMRIDLRGIPFEMLRQINSAVVNRTISMKELKNRWPAKTFHGFFRANRTERAIKRMKNPHRALKNEPPVAFVLESAKSSYLALMVRQPFSVGTNLWGVTPEGRNCEIPIHSLANLEQQPLNEALPDQIVLVPHVKFVTAQTLIYACRP